jgi:uncharacterized protein (UPF0332 family)/predicted nucleotidyltransferase
MDLAIYEKKQRALDFFIMELLKSETKGSIAKIVLFGSLSKGKSREESDIDLLVVASDSPGEVSNACANASLETGLTTGESVEPLVRCIDEVRHPQSYFLYSTLKRGREVYRMNGQELKRKEARNYLDLATEYFDGSKANVKKRYFRIAVDAGYNACELTMKGLLLLRLPNLPGSHGGIVTKFGELFVKTGEISKELARAVHRALEKRNNARYEPHAQITKQDAEEIIDLSEQLQRILEKKLDKS